MVRSAALEQENCINAYAYRSGHVMELAPIEFGYDVDVGRIYG